MKKQVIIKEGYGNFFEDKDLSKLLMELGYNSIFDIKARMDKRVIKWIKDRVNGNNKPLKEIKYKSRGTRWGMEGNCPLVIKEVDTSRLWIIHEYDSAEDIMYIEVLDKENGYCDMKYK